MADDIRCPICNLNLQVFTDRQREEHCDVCLDHVSDPLPIAPAKNDGDSTYCDSTNGSELNSESLGNAEVKVEQHSALPAAKAPRSAFSLLGKRTRSVSLSTPSPAPAARLKSAPTSVESLAADSKKDVPVKQERRPIPFYKTLKFGKTTVAVDAFNYGPIPGVDAYFLTHFHSDHYGGLSKNWTHGTIYCSPATARLAVLKLRVDPEYLHPLELGKEHTINDVNVFLLDANHCPGAAVILFNKHTLHTGDFRATPELAEEIKRITPILRTTYLDTTYLDPVRRFPAQDLVVSLCANYCSLQQEKSVKPSFFLKQPEKRRLLVLVGTYTIGKERLAVSIAQKLNTGIWATPQKRKILNTIDDPEINKLLVDDGLTCQVHLVGMHELSMAKLQEKWKFLKKHFTHLLAFVPTGWTWPSQGMEFNIDTFSDPRTTTVGCGGMIRICRVPYSEHSSYLELEHFCKTIPSEKLIATVHTTRYDLLKSWQA